MHVALEDTEEIVNGRVVNRYGDSFLRGNNSGWWLRACRLECPLC